jgi:hypothetical protein
MNISLIGNSALRLAIQRNLVSFPAQIPAFTKRPGGDTQERIAKLYFSLDWTVRRICDRYGVRRTVVQKLLSDWRVRAVAAGFIQDICPEELEDLVNVSGDCTNDELTAFDGAAYNVAPLLPTGGRDAPSLRNT